MNEENNETKRVKIVIAYDGTAYHGFQIQENAPTIQDTLETAGEKLFGKRIGFTGCSRTDAGVHAEMFVLHADIPAFFPTEKLHLALNTFLPGDIAVKYAENADESFHARYSCIGKTYKYVIVNSAVRDPLLLNRSWHFPYHLDIDKMNEASADIIGKHDFASFMAQGSQVSTTVRTVSECYVERKGETVNLYISADGFLYNMVRIITGTLTGYGTGKITEPMKDIIDSHDRTRAGMTAPPQGLYLHQVRY